VRPTTHDLALAATFAAHCVTDRFLLRPCILVLAKMHFLFPFSRPISSPSCPCHQLPKRIHVCGWFCSCEIRRVVGIIKATIVPLSASPLQHCNLPFDKKQKKMSKSIPSAFHRPRRRSSLPLVSSLESLDARRLEMEKRDPRLYSSLP